MEYPLAWAERYPKSPQANLELPVTLTAFGNQIYDSYDCTVEGVKTYMREELDGEELSFTDRTIAIVMELLKFYVHRRANDFHEDRRRRLSHANDAVLVFVATFHTLLACNMLVSSMYADNNNPRLSYYDYRTGNENLRYEDAFQVVPVFLCIIAMLFGSNNTSAFVGPIAHTAFPAFVENGAIKFPLGTNAFEAVWNKCFNEVHPYAQNKDSCKGNSDNVIKLMKQLRDGISNGGSNGGYAQLSLADRIRVLIWEKPAYPFSEVLFPQSGVVGDAFLHFRFFLNGQKDVIDTLGLKPDEDNAWVSRYARGSDHALWNERHCMTSRVRDVISVHLGNFVDEIQHYFVEQKKEKLAKKEFRDNVAAIKTTSTKAMQAVQATQEQVNREITNSAKTVEKKAEELCKKQDDLAESAGKWMNEWEAKMKVLQKDVAETKEFHKHIKELKEDLKTVMCVSESLLNLGQRYHHVFNMNAIALNDVRADVRCSCHNCQNETAKPGDRRQRNCTRQQTVRFGGPPRELLRAEDTLRPLFVKYKLGELRKLENYNEGLV